ncbi:MAG: hypothetical protein ABSB59_35785 [Streptosporangiaceae bacterium]|jgi:hypothetical protein
MTARTAAERSRTQVPPDASRVTRPTDIAAEDAGPRDLAELCEQFIGVCESAVDPLEISSALEFDGLNDQAARALYGFSDVFALGEEMYRRVPRRPAEPEPVADPWRISKLKSAMHGLIYGLPAVCFPAASGLLNGPGVLRVLVIALLSSWALSQGLAHLGYARLGLSDASPAARVLLPAMTAGTGATGLVMTLTALTEHVHLPALAFGFGLGAYMLGATVLMVLGAERLLLLVLAPAVLGSAAFLALGRPHYLEYAAWGALAATPMLALGLATWRAVHESDLFGRRHGKGAKTREDAGRLITAADLRGALPSAGFGLVVAGLLVFPVAAALPGHPNTGALVASLPLALSMGVAEWTLVWFRRRTQRLLRATREVSAFAYWARLALLIALLRYLTAAAALTAAAVAVATAARLIHPHWAIAPQIAAYLALGGAMFVALLLQAFGSRIFPLTTCTAALAFEVLCRTPRVPGQLTACMGLLVLLTGYAALVLGKAVRHAG